MVIVTYVLAHIIVVSCAIAQLVLARRQIPYCPGTADPKCRGSDVFLMFPPIWTFINTVASVIYWFDTPNGRNDFPAKVFVIHFGLRCFVTIALWFAAFIIAAVIKAKYGCGLGFAIVLLYMYLFTVEWEPKTADTLNERVRELLTYCSDFLRAGKRSYRAVRRTDSRRPQSRIASSEMRGVERGAPQPVRFQNATMFNPMSRIR